MEGIIYIDRFINNPDELFHHLVTVVNWDERMTARKTASFGKAYNYSQISYPFQELLPELETINNDLKTVLGFTPNNCLVNYYLNGKAKMGYHSDQTDILEPGTGIAIVSLGAERTLKFRNITQRETIQEYHLAPSSLVYMTQEIQHTWQHAIPGSDTAAGRISLTFRQIL